MNLRYNTGLHISENGQLLADLLEQVSRAWSRPGLELNILGHSMGGLVARSACFSAERRGLTWIRQLSRLITLGSPHQGSPLEQAGNWIDQLLGLHPYSSPLAQLGKIRSAGVTDLRFGTVVEEQWKGKDRFAIDTAPRIAVPLPQGVACYAIAASRSQSEPGERGDGLVTLKSALGLHADPRMDLRIPEDHRLVVYGANHLDLLAHPQIIAKLKEWMGAAGSG
jgi:pimeloyl-ACP methyl ester carboxylesterase